MPLFLNHYIILNFAFIYHMSDKKFVHLHVHSHYSLLDGLSTPESYAKKAVEQFPNQREIAHMGRTVFERIPDRGYIGHKFIGLGHFDLSCFVILFKGRNCPISHCHYL
jgi:hypothetical protein